MSNFTCSRSCLMKHDLERSVDKLSFMKENWPSFANMKVQTNYQKLNCGVLSVC